jgi:hypothetical protein
VKESALKRKKKIMETLPPQVVEQNVPYDPNNSEAFLYKFTNLQSNKKYIGIHKGKPYDGYLNSSTNEQLHEDWLDPNAQFAYDVLQYGTYTYVQAEEHQMLKEINAKDSDEYYNKSNGGSSLQVPRFPLVKYIVDQIISSKSYDGIVAKYVAIKNLSKFRLQIREFTLLPKHVKRLRDIINDKSSLGHLLVVILKDRLYDGRKGDLIIDGNHSIEAATTSKFSGAGNIPVLEISEDMHKDWTDDEVDLISLMCNPRSDNPRLESSYEDIAREVCKLRMKGLDSASKPIKELKDYFRLSSNEKTKVSKLANEMFAELNPNDATWIDYGTGSEGREIKKLIEKECVTHGHHTGIFSKCISTSKYNAWSDLYDMILYNEKNPNDKITTYKVRWYHKDKNYKDTWTKKWQKNNESVIDSLLKPHGITRDWTYLDEKRSKVTTK